MKQIRKIAWSIFWKTALAGALTGYAAGFVVGFILGFTGTMLGVDKAVLSQVIAILAFLAGIVASFFCFNFFLARAIGKQIGDKRLEVVAAGAFGERT